MSINKELEFNNIISDILKNEAFIELRYEIHHGISRLEHSLNVAKLTFNACKKMGIKDYVDVTRAALLHDFFKSDEVTEKSFLNHPIKALENAKANFTLTEKQENIIISHMYPVSRVMPKYKESWLVSVADKVVAVKECAKYKLPLAIGTTFLFFINFAIIQR